MRYHFKVHKEKAGYRATGLEKGLGVTTQGKTLSTYQKLESSKTANPEWTTLVRLKQVLPLFPLDIAAA